MVTPPVRTDRAPSFKKTRQKSPINRDNFSEQLPKRMTRKHFQTASRCPETMLIPPGPDSCDTREAVINGLRGEERARRRRKKRSKEVDHFYSHFLLFSATTPRDNKPKRMAMVRKSMSLLVPGASQHQGEPRDITDISLSARLHTGFRGTSARNHREHNFIHESHSRRAGPDDRLAISRARSKRAKTTATDQPDAKKRAKWTHTTRLVTSSTSYRLRCSSLGRTYAIDIGEYSPDTRLTVAARSRRSPTYVFAHSHARYRSDKPRQSPRRRVTLTTVRHRDAMFVYMRLKDPEARSLPSDFFVARSKVRRSFDFPATVEPLAPPFPPPVRLSRRRIRCIDRAPLT